MNDSPLIEMQRKKEIMKNIEEFEEKYDLEINPILIWSLLEKYREETGYEVLK